MSNTTLVISNFWALVTETKYFLKFSCLVKRKQMHRPGTWRRNVSFQRGNSVHDSLREGIGEVQFLACTPKRRMKQKSPLPHGCSEHTVPTCFDPQCFHFQQLCSIPAAATWCMCASAHPTPLQLRVHIKPNPLAHQEQKSKLPWHSLTLPQEVQFSS